MIDAHIEIVVTNSDGVITDTQLVPMKSFVGNFDKLIAMWYQLSNSGVTSVVRKDGTSATPNVTNNIWLINASLASSVFGIVVGTGSTAVDLDDYALNFQLVQGTSTNQLYHQAVLFDTLVVSGSSCIIKPKRVFNNLSSGSLTVSEIAMYVSNGGSANIICIARDVLDIPISVGTGSQIQVSYPIKITV